MYLNVHGEYDSLAPSRLGAPAWHKYPYPTLLGVYLGHRWYPRPDPWHTPATPSRHNLGCALMHAWPLRIQPSLKFPSPPNQFLSVSQYKL